jgi:hypothetical protein
MILCDDCSARVVRPYKCPICRGRLCAECMCDRHGGRYETRATRVGVPIGCQKINAQKRAVKR